MKRIIRLSESRLHRIIYESVDRLLKETFADPTVDWNDDELICPYCESNDVQEIRGKDGSWDGYCKCYDCGNVFDIEMRHDF